MKRSHQIVVALALVAGVAVGQDGQPDEKEWRIQGSWVHQWGRGMSVEGPAPSLYKELLLTGGSKWRNAPAPGDMSGPQERLPLPSEWNYDDGYVFRDEDPVQPGDTYYGLTHYWHYEKAGQYDPKNNTLKFTRDRGREGSREEPTSEEEITDDSFPRDGIEIKANRWVHTWLKWDVDMDLTFGVALFPKVDDIKNQRTTLIKAADIRETYTYVDYFATSAGGNWPPISDWYAQPGGYYGTYHLQDGQNDNPVIPLSFQRDAHYNPVTYRDTATIWADVWHIRGEVGPTFTRPLTKKLSAYVAPQFALELVNLDVRRRETVIEDGQTVPVGSREDHEEKTLLAPGFLLTAGANYQINENWFVGASAGWEWLFREVEIHVGPDEAKFDLEGSELNVTVGRKL